jgi:hypothetical protein
MLIWTWWRRGKLKQHSLLTELSFGSAAVFTAQFLLHESKAVWVLVNPRAEYPGSVGGHLLY